MQHPYAPAMRTAQSLLLVLAGYVLLLVGLLLPGISWAQAPASGPTAGTAPSVGSILNPDGTLRPGASCSFNATGYRLGYGPGGQPRRISTAQAGWNGVGGGGQAAAALAY